MDLTLTNESEELKELKRIKAKINTFIEILKQKQKLKNNCKCKNKGECIERLRENIRVLKESYNALIVQYKLDVKCV
jgi:hypothetical protein